MATSETLSSFFEENFKNQITPFLLYKDNQLLKEGKHREFAEEQLKKTNKILFSIAFIIFYGLFWGVTQLIEYGESGDISTLIVGLVALAVTFFGIFRSTKEYYTIKSSMTLFLKLVDDKE